MTYEEFYEWAGARLRELERVSRELSAAAVNFWTGKDTTQVGKLAMLMEEWFWEGQIVSFHPEGEAKEVMDEYYNRAAAAYFLTEGAAYLVECDRPWLVAKILDEADETISEAIDLLDRTLAERGMKQ